MNINITKAACAILAAWIVVCASSHAQPAPAPSPRPPTPPPPAASPATAAAPARDAANYLICVEWKDAKGETNSLEVLTTEGQVSFDGLQKNSVKINNNDVPATLKLNASLSVISEEKGRLQLFLGRTVPYVTGSYNGGSSYSQMSVGLQSTFLVTFGKPVVIKSDGDGTITVLVKRLAD